MRAYLLVDTALHAIPLAEAFEVPQILYGLPEDEANRYEGEIVSAGVSFADMLDISPEREELGEMLYEDLGDATLNTAQKLLEHLAGKRSSADVGSDEVLTTRSEKLKKKTERNTGQ